MDISGHDLWNTALDYAWRGMHALRDAAFPPVCMLCREEIEHDGLCDACWSSVHWLGIEPHNLRGLKTYSLMEYNDFSKKLIIDLKKYDKLFISNFLAEMIYSKFSHLFRDSLYIIPVPIHKQRLLHRLYNQSALIAKRLCMISRENLVYEPEILLKTRATHAQTHLTQRARLKNVKNSFGTSQKLHGYDIILIDDVITTGSTITECANTLKKAGAKIICAISAARVL